MKICSKIVSLFLLQRSTMLLMTTMNRAMTLARILNFQLVYHTLHQMCDHCFRNLPNCILKILYPPETATTMVQLPLLDTDSQLDISAYTHILFKLTSTSRHQQQIDRAYAQHAIRMAILLGSDKFFQTLLTCCDPITVVTMIPQLSKMIDFRRDDWLRQLFERINVHYRQVNTLVGYAESYSPQTFLTFIHPMMKEVTAFWDTFVPLTSSTTCIHCRYQVLRYSALCSEYKSVELFYCCTTLVHLKCHVEMGNKNECPNPRCRKSPLQTYEVRREMYMRKAPIFIPVHFNTPHIVPKYTADHSWLQQKYTTSISSSKRPLPPTSPISLPRLLTSPITPPLPPTPTVSFKKPFSFPKQKSPSDSEPNSKALDLSAASLQSKSQTSNTEMEQDETDK